MADPLLRPVPLGPAECHSRPESVEKVLVELIAWDVPSTIALDAYASYPAPNLSGRHNLRLSLR
jgi:hypothetical protein